MTAPMEAKPIVIDLSSDSAEESQEPAQPFKKATNIYQFSDPFDDLEEISAVRAGKRRRLNGSDSSDKLGADVLKPTRELAANYQKVFSGGLLQAIDDEIVVSSSPQELEDPAAGQTLSTSQMINPGVANPSHTDQCASQNLSFSTAALLAEISSNVATKGGRPGAKGDSTRSTSVRAGSYGRNGLLPERSVKKQIETQSNRLEKALAREAKLRESQLAKQTEAARRQAIKDQATREKQLAADFTKANQARQWDKKNSSSRMIVDICSTLASSPTGSKITTTLQQLSIEYTTKPMDPPNIITWRRKIDTIFNEELNYWELAEEEIINEKYVLCLFEGEAMCRILFGGAGNSELDELIGSIKRSYASYQILFLLEGVDAGLRKFRNKSNKTYRNAVRQGNVIPAADDIVPQDHAAMVESVEETLLHLQVSHGCGVLQTSESNETAGWITAFTEQISVAPSRVEKDNLEADLCMEVGQIRAGEDSRDTFIKMLQQVTRLTAPIAYGIAQHYPDVPSLTRAFESGGPLILQDIKKCANSDGAVTDARIGPQISRRLAQIFLERDPDITEI